MNFAVDWEFRNNPAVLGTGAVLTFTVDNGGLSPLNQTFLFGDVTNIFVNTTSFGGTYAKGWAPILQVAAEQQPLFSTNGSGGALINFALGPANGTSFESLAVVMPGTFIVPTILNFFWSANMIRFVDAQLLNVAGLPLPVIGEEYSARAIVPSGQLVGAVAVPESTHTLALLVLAFGCLAAARRRVADVDR